MQRRGLLAWLIDCLYGYDVFLSYTRIDDPESRYALALYARLTNGSPRLRCFIDEKHLSSDRILDEALKSQIRSSRIIAILAGIGASDREAMLAEARYAVGLGKRVMVIDRGIGWVARKTPLKEIVGERLSVTEPSSRPTPSRRVTAAIRRNVGVWRVNLVRQCAILSAFAVVISLAGASYSSYRAEAKARTEATKQQGLAEERERSERAAREDTEGVFEFLRRDVRPVLVSVGRMELMEGISLKIRDYYTKNAATFGKAGMLNSQSHEEFQRGELLLESGQIEEAKKAFNSSRQLGLQGVEASGNQVWRALAAQAATRIGDLVRRIPGADLSEAETRYKEAVQISEDLRKLVPDEGLWFRTWIAAQGGLADLKLNQGDAQGALTILAELDRSLIKKVAGDVKGSLAKDHALVLQQISKSYLRQHQLIEALTAAQRMMVIAEPFANSRDRKALELAARSRSFLADVYREAGDFVEARVHYGRVAQTMRVLVASEDRNAVWLELAATSSLSFGDECARAGQGNLAIEEYREGLSYAERCWKADLTNWMQLDNVVAAARRLTRSLRERARGGDADESRRSWERGREAVETIVRQAPPDDPKAQGIQRSYEEFTKEMQL